MKAIVNRQMFEQTSFDSGVPSGSAAVVHRFDEAGQYEVHFLGEKEAVVSVPLTVGAEIPGQGPAREQATIDLTKVLFPTKMRDAPAHRDPIIVRPGGYVSFTTSGAAKPAPVIARPAGPDKHRGAAQHAYEERTPSGFDSRRLMPGDIFTVTLLRPGEYSLVNEQDGSKGSIVMAYPVVGDRPYRPPTPVTVECTDKGFQPDRISLQPVQGLIFHIKAPARIKIALVRPDDGPAERPKHRYGISREAMIEAIERLRQKREEKDGGGKKGTAS